MKRATAQVGIRTIPREKPWAGAVGLGVMPLRATRS